MRAVVFEGVEAVATATVPDPTPIEAGDAVVAVRVAGLCGSDLHPYFGREEGLEPGTVMGHELAGEVVAVGAGVRRFVPGDRVVSPFSTCCGACDLCRRGLTGRCPRGELLGWRSGGRGLHGAQAELVRVPLADATLVAVPEGLPLELALLTGDILATGWFAAERCSAGSDDVVAVVGCGPVGLCAVLALSELGVDRVVATDPVGERLGVAATFGAEPLDPSAGPVPEQLDELTGGRGADAVVEAAGGRGASRLAWELARPGGTISAVGVHPEPHFAFSPSEAYDRNLTYRTGRCPARSYMEPLLERLPRLAPRLARLISHRLPLAAAPEAYRRFGSREAGWLKVVFEPR